jgi:hypothetical protein
MQSEAFLQTRKMLTSTPSSDDLIAAAEEERIGGYEESFDPLFSDRRESRVDSAFIAGSENNDL